MSAFDVYNDVSGETAFRFFLPLGNILSLTIRKNESDKNPVQTQLKLFPYGEEL